LGARGRRRPGKGAIGLERPWYATGQTRVKLSSRSRPAHIIASADVRREAGCPRAALALASRQLPPLTIGFTPAPGRNTKGREFCAAQVEGIKVKYSSGSHDPLRGLVVVRENDRPQLRPSLQPEL